tara:strand:- start:826 stop:2928 length:2103 start_codon:yes stop_codon:yes gene_type:complete
MLLDKMGKTVLQQMREAVMLLHTKAGKSSAQLVQAFVNDVLVRCKDVKLDGEFIIDRDDEGVVSLKGINEVAGFVFTLLKMWKSRNPEALKLLDTDTRIKSHRQRPLEGKPVTPGTTRLVVSGRPMETIDTVGEITSKALEHVSKCSHVVVSGKAYLRAKEAIADPRIVSKLKKTKVEDLTGRKIRLTYFDMLAYSIEAIEDAARRSGKSHSDIVVCFEIFVDRDGRVYMGGALSPQSAKWIQVLTMLPEPSDLTKPEVASEVAMFWKSEFKLDFYDRELILSITNQSLADWFVDGGCPKVYEHAWCARESWDTEAYYLPVEVDMMQSFAQLCAMLVGDIESLVNTGMIVPDGVECTNAWESQDRAMQDHSPRNVLDYDSLSFEERKTAKKGAVTVTGYNAGIGTATTAFLKPPEDFILVNLPEGETLAMLLGRLDPKGRTNAEYVIQTCKKAGISITQAKDLVYYSKLFMEDVSLSISTATPATVVMQKALQEAAWNGLESDTLQEWTDATDFVGQVSMTDVLDDGHLSKRKRNRIYATPNFPPVKEDGKTTDYDNWFEGRRQRSALRFLPTVINSSPLSLMPCFVQGALESAILRMFYYMLSRVPSLKSVYVASRHDCLIMDAAYAPAVREVFYRALFRVARKTDLLTMFDHLDIPSVVEIERWNSKGVIIRETRDIVDPDRAENLQLMKETMNPFGI